MYDNYKNFNNIKWIGWNLTWFYFQLLECLMDWIKAIFEFFSR